MGYNCSTILNINLINVYSCTYTKYNIEICIAETNFNLESSWEFNHDETPWKERKWIL